LAPYYTATADHPIMDSIIIDTIMHTILMYLIMLIEEQDLIQCQAHAAHGMAAETPTTVIYMCIINWIILITPIPGY